jgi:hypothetical protein
MKHVRWCGASRENVQPTSNIDRCTFLDAADGVQSIRITDSASKIAARLHRIRNSATAQHLRERLAARDGPTA